LPDPHLERGCTRRGLVLSHGMSGPTG
jgi:hypothetical protein